MFHGKTLLITGGTGSFGSMALKRLIETGISEIRIFSRDEKKQEDLRLQYNSKKLKFYIGDVRDPASLVAAMQGVDYVFHAAALKQVPSCEFFPLEAVKTNVLGTENVLNAAVATGVERVVCLSTDKAVYPINAMGISKAMMEKIIGAKARNAGETQISITRYGNVIGSRGSVIPLFLNQIRAGKDLTITKSQMTRFMMTLEQSVDLVIFAFENGRNGDIFVQKAPAADLGTLARAVPQLLGKDDWPVTVIGVRHGEKDYESLLSVEEYKKAENLGNYFRVRQDSRDLNYAKYTSDGDSTNSISLADYNSSNTTQLDEKGLLDLLRTTSVLEV
jgi:UDP-N-acetylglucosamine 4,6-dehydratase/5-epimerase